jgi:hypothetical protein
MSLKESGTKRGERGGGGGGGKKEIGENTGI